MRSVGKSYWEINYIVTTAYITLAQTHHSNFVLHCFNAKLLWKDSQNPVWPLWDSCPILDLINFQNNPNWSNSNTPEISLECALKYSKSSHLACIENFPLIRISSIWSVSMQPQLSKTCWVIWLSKDQSHYDYNQQWHNALSVVAFLRSCQPNPQRNQKRNMFDIKQINICVYVTQASAGFVRYTCTSVYRTDKPALAWAACPGILHRF